jgi:tRNA threonylcarbamoyladenosine biosynthesis protein TsaB
MILREDAGDPSKPQAARLPGDLIAILEQTGITLSDIDLFAVVAGPGSFTGLRIGIATMQGLAFAERKPLIGVSGFDALERSSRLPFDFAQGASSNVEGLKADATGAREASGYVATWVDAWRGEVYAALYQAGREVMLPVVARPDELLANLPATGEPITFIGDGANTYRDLIGSTLADRARVADPASPLLAGVIAQMATEAAATATHLPPPHAIRPLYVRRPDAELARAPRVP